MAVNHHPRPEVHRSGIPIPGRLTGGGQQPPIRLGLARVDRTISPVLFTPDMPPPHRRPGIDRVVKRRHRDLVNGLARDLIRLRTDSGATHGRVAQVAGIDRSHYSRIESGEVRPSFETLVAIATALGADVSVRLYPGSGPRLTDRHQARMVEALLRALHHSWRAHVEVPVSRPARGVIDIVLEQPSAELFVATELHSEVHRLEQEIRWAADKARSLDSSHLRRAGSEPEPIVSTMLVLRSTATTRAVARQFEATLGAAYPAQTSLAVSSLRAGTAWPGPSLVWIRIQADDIEILDGPPRGVSVGR